MSSPISSGSGTPTTCSQIPTTRGFAKRVQRVSGFWPSRTPRITACSPRNTCWTRTGCERERRSARAPDTSAGDRLNAQQLHELVEVRPDLEQLGFERGEGGDPDPLSAPHIMLH